MLVSPARLAAMGWHQEVWRLPAPGEVVRPPERHSRAGCGRRAVWPQAQAVRQSGQQQGRCKSGQGQRLQGGHDSQHWCALCRLSSFKSVLLLIHIPPNWEQTFQLQKCIAVDPYPTQLGTDFPVSKVYSFQPIFHPIGSRLSSSFKSVLLLIHIQPIWEQTFQFQMCTAVDPYSTQFGSRLSSFKKCIPFNPYSTQFGSRLSSSFKSVLLLIHIQPIWEQTFQFQMCTAVDPYSTQLGQVEVK